MPTYLEIAVNVSQVTESFHYHLPVELQGCIMPGHLVEVPFGNQTVQGVVLRFISQPAVPETRPVLGLVDQGVVLTTAQLALAREMSRSTLTSLAACIGLMLPAGVNQMVDTLYQLAERTGIHDEQGSEGQVSTLSETQTRLLALLKRRGGLRGRQIDQAMPHVNWRASARALVRRERIISRSVLPPPTVQPKYVRTVQLARPPEEVEAQLDSLGKPKSPALARRQAILLFLMREAGPVEVAWVYAESGGKIADLYFLAERELIVLGESEVWRDPLANLEMMPSDPPVLTPDQKVVWDELRNALQSTQAGRRVPPLLLHGVTGSGKTEIYLNAAQETLALGMQAIILVPEIALTPQTIRRFAARFPGQVGTLHSRLSPGERYDTWRRARAGQLSIVVGPRSALFTPFAKLGLIVVDECHDDSYYQGETPPFYHAQEAALTYARLAGAVCLFGTATPDVTNRYRAFRERWHYLSLPARILAHHHAVQAQVERLGLPTVYKAYSEQAHSIQLPPVEVIDMREELKAGNPSIFSRALEEALRNVLEREQQAILFLNRRGTATFVFCRDCGFALKCKNCELPLTYHARAKPDHLASSRDDILLCHHCGYKRSFPKKCPQCSSDRIRYYGVGTEQVEAEIQALYPEARTLRWDYETTRQKGAHEVILSHFFSHRADILIGTQMLAKGLDLPLVTLVGVVLADVGLNLPDYRSGERTFQVLTQVAGRAGRSPLGGQVYLQTFRPDHYAIQAAARHDYQAFYQREIEYRRHLGYPPFARLVRLEFRDRDPALVEATAVKWATRLRGWIASRDRRATQLIGPAPCFYARLGGQYRWQIILRGPDPASLLRNRALGECRIEIDPPSLL